jgi:hypothetical protein
MLVSCNAVFSPLDGSNTTNLTNVGDDQAKVLTDNPVMLANNINISSTDMNSFQSQFGVEITSDISLIKNCSFTYGPQPLYTHPLFGVVTGFGTLNAQSCITVGNDENELVTQALTKNEFGNWGYDANSQEFLQVNGYYHSDQFIERYIDFLQFAYFQSDYNFLSTMPFEPKMFWFYINDDSNGSTNDYQPLTLFTRCAETQQNAFYRPTPRARDVGPSICMGVDDNIPGFAFSQDPTIIYHEYGHAFAQLMLNIRNESSIDLYQASMGNVFYDEAGAINEAIADYISYIMTDRPFVGEYGMQKFYRAGRTMTEDIDEVFGSHPVGNIHVATLDNEADSRLSYPTYVQYDPAQPDSPFEDVHYASQTIGHFFVAVTEMLKNQCSLDQETSENYVLLLMSEALAEMGDLSSSTSDFIALGPNDAIFPSPLNIAGPYVNNTVPFLAPEMVTYNNTPNFRRFTQIFSKQFLYRIINNACFSRITKNNYEQLVDSYGLLLFKTYNDDYDTSANSIYPIAGANTSTDISNRKNSVLVSKDFLRLPQPDTDPEGRQPGFVFDDQFSIPAILENLTFQGKNVLPTPGLASTDFNNSNNKISPGEVVGLVLNVVNDSNTTIGGLQILANDWDHMKKEGMYYKPCSIEGFPLSSEGAASTTNSTFSGGCEHYSGQGMMDPGFDGLIDIDLNADGFITGGVSIDSVLYNEANAVDPSGIYFNDGSTMDANGLIDKLRPICLVQQRNENETIWVSQNEYRKNKVALTDNECLGKDEGSDFDGDSCLIRFLPGANQTFFSKLDAQKTWAETIQGNSSNAPTFNSSAAFLMEVNKWVPPGTTFACRFRARFTNCDDCYHDPNMADNDDYVDYEFNGPNPFKVIDFQFTVID